MNRENSKSLAHRKRDHIHLALEGQGFPSGDSRFYYEPLFGHHNLDEIDLSRRFLGKIFKAPLWISGMTGGVEEGRLINQRLARGVAQLGLGMGLGSFRPLLEGRRSFEDFNVRPILGPHRVLFGNIGISQVDILLKEGRVGILQAIMEDLQCDGMVVHINPLQEWNQPEGNCLFRSPFSILEEFLGEFQAPVLVKEVGQGMGPRSLQALMDLPLAAIELSGFGGTNFTRLEWERGRRQGEGKEKDKGHGELAGVGHGAKEMIYWINQRSSVSSTKCREFIISGGIRSFLDGYYLMKKLKAPCIYGQAAAVLKRAIVSQEELNAYLSSQIDGLKMAHSFLQVQ